MAKRGVHKTLQRGGVCWDCGRPGAKPVYSLSKNRDVDRIGWECECGRWWPVKAEDFKAWHQAIEGNPLGLPPSGGKP